MLYIRATYIVRTVNYEREFSSKQAILVNIFVDLMVAPCALQKGELDCGNARGLGAELRECEVTGSESDTNVLAKLMAGIRLLGRGCYGSDINVAYEGVYRVHCKKG